MSGEQPQSKEMNAVKDLVEEHFARALSSAGQGYCTKARSSSEDIRENQDAAGNEYTKHTHTALEGCLLSPPTIRERGRELYTHNNIEFNLTGCNKLPTCKYITY